MIDTSTATELGKILGADAAVLVGDINDYVNWTILALTGSTVSFSMRLIDVTSSQVITSGAISRVENLKLAFQNAQNLARELVEEIGRNRIALCSRT